MTSATIGGQHQAERHLAAKGKAVTSAPTIRPLPDAIPASHNHDAHHPAEGKRAANGRPPACQTCTHWRPDKLAADYGLQAGHCTRLAHAGMAPRTPSRWRCGSWAAARVLGPVARRNLEAFQ